MVATTKRIAHVLRSSRGGIRRHVRYLAENPPEGYETLGVWGPAGLAGYFDGLPFASASRWRVPRGADVIHGHGFEAGLVALSILRPPVVMTAHIDLETQGRTSTSRLFRAVALLCAARADAVIAVSDRAAKRFKGAHVIAPAFAPLAPPRRSRSDIRSELSTPDDRAVVVTVARLHRDKGLDRFIDAVAATGAEGWICGDGPLLHELSKRAEGTGVRLLGYRDDVAEILSAADVFALPSVGEAYGIAVVEAISAGLPVVVSATGAMPEIARDAGLVVAPGDAHGFAAAVASLVSDGELRARLAARAKELPVVDPIELVRSVGEVYDEVTT